MKKPHFKNIYSAVGNIAYILLLCSLWSTKLNTDFLVWRAPLWFDTMEESLSLDWMNALKDDLSHLVESWMRKQKYLPAILANISPIYIAVIGSTLLTLLITMCVTSGNKQSSDPSKEKSNPKRSILRKAAPEGKHLIKKTSFAELPPEAMPSKASGNFNCCRSVSKNITKIDGIPNLFFKN